MKPRLLFLLTTALVAGCVLLAIKFFPNVIESSISPPVLTQQQIEHDREWQRVTGSGQDKRMSGDYAGAIIDFTRAIELEPEDDWCYWQRAIAKRSLDDFDGAIADFTSAIAFREKRGLDSVGYYGDRGAVKQIKGDFKGAAADYTMVLNMTSEVHSRQPVLYLRGIVEYLDGAFEKALADFELCANVPETSEVTMLGSKGGQSWLSSYVHIDIWTTLIKLGRSEEANQQLQAYVDVGEKQTPRRRREAQEDAQFLAAHPGSKISRPNDFDDVANYLLGRAVNPRFTNLGQYYGLTESSHLYYAGMKALFSSDKVQAATFFRNYLEVIKTNRDGYTYLTLEVPWSCHRQIIEFELKNLDGI